MFVSKQSSVFLKLITLELDFSALEDGEKKIHFAYVVPCMFPFVFTDHL